MIKRLTLIIVVMVLTFASCSKYEDGPAFALSSVNSRITNSWGYTTVLRNNLNITLGEQDGDLIYSSSSFGLADDGRFSYIDVYRMGTSDSTDRGDGYWEFIDNNQKVKLIYDDITKSERTLIITRLERRFLWLKEDLGDNNTLEMQMTAN